MKASLSELLNVFTSVADHMTDIKLLFIVKIVQFYTTGGDVNTAGGHLEGRGRL